MDNINDIISSLSSEDIEMLKGVASSILGNQNDTSTTPAPPSTNNNSKMNTDNLLQGVNALSSLGLNQDDFNMMMKAKTIFDRMNRANSKNADLILALKPHLSEQSREKADQAIKMLKLFEVLPMLKDLF